MVPLEDGAAVIALLRGINVVGKKKVPMATLRSLAQELGWRSVATYINSGNLVCAAKGAPAKLARLLEGAIEEQFGFDVAVIVRTAADWRRYAAGSAFADVETTRPSALLLALAQGAPPKDIARVLQPYCGAGERVAVRGDALWIDYASGVARSKLTPAVLDRAVGSPVTARNWNTVQALARMLEA
ncbi:MAG TPA: DUF1697 domain-containing protein [Planctomycetota bacterium]|nr:DUF1697 domain-containing protein [Planctomycetota bacterium]